MLAVNMNGSQTLSALAYATMSNGDRASNNAKVSAFGADSTDLRKYTGDDESLGQDVGNTVDDTYG
jgi:hypothetical protein